MSIAEKTELIRSATYGKDVRESIASGIEMINTEVESTTSKQVALESTFEDLIINAGNSNAEIVVARKGEVDLATKIGKIDSSLSDKAQQTDLVITNETMASNSLRLLVQENKKISQTDITEELLAQIVGTTAINAVPADKSITNKKMSFPVVEGMDSINLFDKATVTLGKYVEYNTGNIIDVSYYAYSDLIPISSSTVYTISAGLHFVYYDVNKVYISGVDNQASPCTFTTPSNAKYMRFTIFISPITNLDTVMMVLGSILPSTYVGFGKLLKLKSVSEKNIDDTLLNKINSVQGTEKLLRASPNLYNKATVTLGHYIEYNTGNIIAVDYYGYSDYIPIKSSTLYKTTVGVHFVFYDSNKTYISGLENSINGTITTPSNAMYVRFTVVCSPLTLLDTVMFVEGNTLPSEYVGFEKQLALSVVKEENISPSFSAKLFPNKTFKILIPSVVYLTKGENFSLYYENLIYGSQSFLKGTYYIVQEQKNGDGSYVARGVGYDYKWTYTPLDTDTNFVMEFRIISTYNDEIIATKLVDFIVSPTKTAKTANVYSIGDSFADDCGIVIELSKMFKTRLSGVNLPTFKGLNSAGSQWILNDPDAVGVYDDAFSGETYIFYTTKDRYSYLRYDRPLADAYWDVGWGLNEVNGWTNGQTFANLTATQKSHGKTKNQFWNPSTSKFDFSYYMNTYQASSVVDIFFMLCGINDAIWYSPTELKTKLPITLAKMQEIITSIHAYNPNIKICIHTVPSHKKDQNFFSSQNTFIHYERSKRAQELFNDMVLSNFDTTEMKTVNTFVMPSGYNYDTRFALEEQLTYPNKFDNSYSEIHSYSIHPDRRGAKWIADTMYNYIYNLALR